MDKFNNYLSKATCCAILLLLPVFINVGQAVGASTQNVNVVNTPLPVAITNTPLPVPLPVSEIANPAFQPFQAYAQFTMGVGSYSISGALFDTPVPAGKRLVIEHVSVIASTMPVQGEPMAAMGATINTGLDAQYYLVLTGQGNLGGAPTFVASQPMRVYANPGGIVNGICYRVNLSEGTAGCNFSISGYLVDIP